MHSILIFYAVINDADYDISPPKLTTKNDKKAKSELEKKREEPATPLRHSKLRGAKKEAEPAVEYVPPKKQTKTTTAAPSAKHAAKSTSKSTVVDTKTTKKQAVNIKVQPKKEDDENRGLEELYYGIRDGLDDYFENYPNNSDAAAQLHCPICKDEVLTTNTTLQKHLFSHINIHDDPSGQKNEQCQTCLLKFHTVSALEKHQSVHRVVTRGKEANRVQFNCLICQQSQSNLQNLTLHLQKSHNMLELPYHCQGCGYRTSAHRDMIRHFYEDHHQHNFLQCPFCLDIYHFSHKGHIRPDHIDLFLVHLRQHAEKIRQAQEIKCNKCILSYVEKGALKYHKYYHHTSWVKNTSNIRPLVESSQVIPYPKVRSHHRNQLQYSVLEKLGEFFAFIDGSICAECNCEIINEEHYPSLLKCNKCHFKTCCERAMFSHSENCNGETESRFAGETALDSEIHCVCGFSTAIGNKMAAHLASCGQKSAYPSLEVAVENTVKRNMLDMLGLVRRDGETTSEQPDAEKAVTEENDVNTTVSHDNNALPFNVMDTDENNQSFTQLVDSTMASNVVAPFQTQLDFVPPQLPLGSGEIDMPLIGDLSDPNTAAAPAQYLGEVHTPMFDAIADAEQQHYHQMIHEQPNGQQ